MRLLVEKFHKPENFDAVADGAGWVMYAGGNDWENGITGICVTFPSDEQLQRIWVDVKHKHDPGAESSEHADETKEWGQRAWRTWKRAAVEAHRNKNHGTRSWQDAFKSAVTSEDMKPFVKEWGTERTQWGDVKEHATSMVSTLLEVEDPEVERYLQQVKPKPHRLSKEFLRYVMSTPEGRKKLLNLRDQPEPPSEPHRIVREVLGDVPPDPEPSPAEVERLLPTKTYTLAGNSMIHAPGVIRMAQNEWRNGRKKQKAWAMNLIHAWEGLPEEVYLAILNNKVDIETQGDSAVITVKQY